DANAPKVKDQIRKGIHARNRHAKLIGEEVGTSMEAITLKPRGGDKQRALNHENEISAIKHTMKLIPTGSPV
ncbi:MAG: hypothetical protein M1831_007145, partial [Alyxoria varia]